MASLTKDGELYSFDVPEIDRQSSSHTLYKIVLQVTPKELTENSYQVCLIRRLCFSFPFDRSARKYF